VWRRKISHVPVEQAGHIIISIAIGASVKNRFPVFGGWIVFDEVRLPYSEHLCGPLRLTTRGLSCCCFNPLAFTITYITCNTR
jgi:hypothetical protein